MKCKRCNYNDALESNGSYCAYCNLFIKKHFVSITETEWWKSVDKKETDLIYLGSPNKVPCEFLTKSASNPIQVRIKYDDGSFRDLCPNTLSTKDNWERLYSKPPKYGLTTLKDVTDLLLVDMNMKNHGYTGLDLATGSNNYIWHKCEKCGKPKQSIVHHFVKVTKQCNECANLQRSESVTQAKLNNRSKKIFDIANTVMIENLGLGKGRFRCKICNTVYNSRGANILNSFDRFGTNCCPRCYVDNIGVSKVEIDFIEYIKSFYTGEIITQYKIGNYYGDIFLPDINLIIEVDGLYWHSEANIGTDRHKSFKKKNLYDSLGYKSIFIRDYEILSKTLMMKEKIKYIISDKDNVRIRASKVNVKIIPWNQVDFFLKKYHFMGSGERCEIRYGLFEDDNLIGVATFKGERTGNIRTEDLETVELIRFATSKKIMGGLSKVIKFMIQNQPEITQVITYADRRFSQKNNNLYTNNGFVLHDSNPRSSYLWYKGMDFLQRYQTQKHHLKILFPEAYAENRSETDILWLSGYHRIYDCGHYKYVYNVK